MGGTGKKGEDARKGPKEGRKDDSKSRKKPPSPVEDDDIEDGDFATPKRDRGDGNDDQPL
jgi:hypothetical protein